MLVSWWKYLRFTTLEKSNNDQDFVPLPTQENSIFVLQSSMCNMHSLKNIYVFFALPNVRTLQKLQISFLAARSVESKIPFEFKQAAKMIKKSLSHHHILEFTSKFFSRRYVCTQNNSDLRLILKQLKRFHENLQVECPSDCIANNG